MCEKERWNRVATGLRKDFKVIGGKPTITSRDVRSGNPHTESSIRLGPIASSTPPDRLKFTYEYVVGYGSYGKKVPKKIRGPKFTVSVVNAKGSTAGGKKCKCNGRTSKLGSSGPDCESLYQGKRHCYVDIGTCSDGKRSSQLKTPPSDWSLLACKDVVSTLVCASSLYLLLMYV